MPKYDKEKKVRVEIFFDKKEDADVIEYMDQYGSSRAGWIRSALKEYVAAKKILLNSPLNGSLNSSVFQQNVDYVDHQKEQQDKQQDSEKNKPRTKKVKKIPVLGQSFSASDFDDI